MGMNIGKMAEPFTIAELSEAVFQQGVLGVAVVELATGRYVRANARFSEIVGYPLEDLLQRTFQHITHPEDLAQSVQLREALGAGQVREYHYLKRYLRSDGSIVWGNVSVSALGKPGQPCRYALVFLADMTDAKRVERALQASERQYRELVEGANCIMLCLNERAEVTFINTFGERFFGYPRQEILGRPAVGTIVPESESTGRDLRALIEDIVRHPQKYQLNINENICRDGRRVWIEWNNRPVLDEQGRLREVFCIGWDITSRRQAELAEREARLFLQTILDTVPARVFWKDRQSRYLGCNMAFARDAQLSSPAEIVGKTDYDLIWKERAPDYQAVDQQVIATGQPRLRYELKIDHPDKSQSWLVISKTPLRDGHGNIIGVLGLYEDITDRKIMELDRERLQQQLLQAQKMESVGRLAGGVAHDFNNMLQAILGNVEMALQEEGLSGAAVDALREIQRSAERSAALTQQLLGFARKQAIAPRRLDLNEEIGQLLRMLRRLIGEDIQLQWMPGAGIGWVWLDPGQLSQVLANLVVNARDAIGGRTGGRITIETERVMLDAEYVKRHPEVAAGEYVMVAVSDNGQGMTAEVKGKLFEPFFTTKDVGKGTGLGLATVYGIMKQNRGHVCVYSEEGKGATFKLYFPRLEGEAEKSEAEGNPGNKEIPGARGEETVLLVEDEAQVLVLTQRLLERRGYRVLAARSGEEALRLVEGYEGRIDLLVTDVVMSGMNGRELRDRLRKRWPALKCLFMSGYTANVIAHHGVLEEGIHFVSKPFTVKDFCQQVRRALDED